MRSSVTLAGVVLGVAIATSGTAPAASPAVAGEAARASACRPADRAFAPTSLTIPGVVGRTKVLALGRDSRGVPRTPPLTSAGKWQVAWDRSRIRPGSRHGVVRLSAHTYPAFAGTALGNRLLDALRLGDRIDVAGPRGERLCYRVTRRVTVRAEQSAPAFYATGGPPRLAILVCSGVRRGPGDWSHRTIWYAIPLPTDS